MPFGVLQSRHVYVFIFLICILSCSTFGHCIYWEVIIWPNSAAVITLMSYLLHILSCLRHNRQNKWQNVCLVYLVSGSCRFKFVLVFSMHSALYSSLCNNQATCIAHIESVKHHNIDYTVPPRPSYYAVNFLNLSSIWEHVQCFRSLPNIYEKGDCIYLALCGRIS